MPEQVELPWVVPYMPPPCAKGCTDTDCDSWNHGFRLVLVLGEYGTAREPPLDLGEVNDPIASFPGLTYYHDVWCICDLRGHSEEELLSIIPRARLIILYKQDKNTPVSNWIPFLLTRARGIKVQGLMYPYRIESILERHK